MSNIDLEKFLSRYHSQGDVIDITLVEGGRQDGLDYGPVVVRVVVLDDDTVAFRMEGDYQDTDWRVGSLDELCEFVDEMRELYAK